MAHFAEIDENNIVTRVLVTDNSYPEEGYQWLMDNFGGRWIQTSYNARIRGKFAGIGDIYDEQYDVFYSPKPYPSWILKVDNSNVPYWTAPVPRPVDNDFYIWNELDLIWEKEITDLSIES